MGALLFLTSLAFLRRQTHPLTLALFDSSSARLPREPKLHFLLPATNSPYEFCKTLLTTLVNDYEPIVINWGSKARDSAARIEKVSKLGRRAKGELRTRSAEQPVRFWCNFFRSLEFTTTS